MEGYLVSEFDPLYALVCQNKKKGTHYIPLPSALRPAAPGQTSWPEGHSKLNFLCPSCEHAYAYSVENVQAVARAESQGPPSLRDKSSRVICLLVRCWDASGCDAHVLIRTLMAYDVDPRLLAAHELLAQSTVEGVYCTAGGHALSGSVPRVGELRATATYFDEMWAVGVPLNLPLVPKPR